MPDAVIPWCWVGGRQSELEVAMKSEREASPWLVMDRAGVSRDTDWLYRNGSRRQRASEQAR